MTHAKPTTRRSHLRRTLRTALTTGAVLAVLTGGTALGAPAPTFPHIVTVQPDTDSVVLSDYLTTAPVTVQVLRGGVLIATSQSVTPVSVGPNTLVEVNAVGAAVTGVCWQDTTPDIVYGDVIRVTQNGVIEDSTVLHLTVSQPVNVNVNTVAFHGTAQNTDGTRLGPGLMPDMRLTNPAFGGSMGANGQSIRVPGALGTIEYDLATDTTWTARFTPLDSGQHTAALSFATNATVAWTSAAGSEVTEATLGALDGPQAPCIAPILTEQITSITPPAFLFNSTSLTVGGVADTDVVTVSLTISDTNPFTADVVTPPLAIGMFGGGKAWSTTFPGPSIFPLTDGTLTITPTFTTAGLMQRTGPVRTITKDMVVPDLMPPVASIVSGPRPFARSTVATFDLASNEPGTFQCRLDTAAFAPCSDPTRLIGLTQGSHTFSARAIDGAGNVSAEVTRTWQVDIKRPGLTGRVTAGQRGTLARRGIVIAVAACDERCTVTFDAKIVVPGAIPGRARVLSRPLTLDAAAKGLPRTRVGRMQLEAIQRSLRAGRTVLVFFNITAVDRVGNRTIIHTSVRLTRSDLG